MVVKWLMLVLLEEERVGFMEVEVERVNRRPRNGFGLARKWGR